MRRYFMAAGTSLLAIGLLFACHLLGVLSSAAFYRSASLVLLTALAFYIVFRSGLNRSFGDPSLTVPQTSAATLVILYAMYAADRGRAVFLVLLLMVFLFGVLRLTTRALLIYAAGILIAYGAMIGLLWRFKPQSLDLRLEVLQWLALALTLPWFAVMGGFISGLRKRLRQSNEELQGVLQRVQASESSLAEAQRIAGLGGWTFDPVHRSATWSVETYRLFGIDPARPAPIGEQFLDLVHPDDREHYNQLVRPALREGRDFDDQFRIVLPNGEIRWMHALGQPVVDASGHTTLLRGTVMDITEHNAKEAALTLARDQAAAARATLVDAIESLTDAFALFDAEDRLILCNRRYAQSFTNFDRFEDIAGMRFEDLVRSSLAKGEVIEPEFQGDGEAWVTERIRRHRNPNPAPRVLQLSDGRWFQITEQHTRSGGIVGVRRDITGQKQIEQRQAMEHAVTLLLAESGTVGDALPKIIQTICETLGWDCGACWRWDAQDQLLRCDESWSIASTEVREFVALSSQQRFAPASVGLIGRVCATSEPIWIADVSRDPGFQRRAIAAKTGLSGAFAFPIKVGAELYGVMEFFIRDVRQSDPALLAVTRSIGSQIGQFIARKAAEEQIRQLAHFDGLTGLANRNLFDQLLAHALRKAQRLSKPLAILFIDLDGFKQVNDRLGHDAGDRLLAAFAQRLRECLRESDAAARLDATGTPARVGGDEFLVFIDDFTEPSQLVIVAQRILASAAKPFALDGEEGHVTASIGISIFPDDGKDIDTLAKNADSAMYCAKQAGKNGYRFFSAPVKQGI